MLYMMACLYSQPLRMPSCFPVWANGLLIISSAGIDARTLFIAIRAVLGATVRPFLGLLILISLRRFAKALHPCRCPRE